MYNWRTLHIGDRISKFRSDCSADTRSVWFGCDSRRTCWFKAYSSRANLYQRCWSGWKKCWWTTGPSNSEWLALVWGTQTTHRPRPHCWICNCVPNVCWILRGTLLSCRNLLALILQRPPDYYAHLTLSSRRMCWLRPSRFNSPWLSHTQSINALRDFAFSANT